MDDDKQNIEDLKRYLTYGLLVGGGAASLATLLRTYRLNKKLKTLQDLKIEHDDDTVVVSLPRERVKQLRGDIADSSLSKYAQLSPVYGLAAFASSGLISYAALTALYKKLEDNRMKQVEEEARERAVKKLVNVKQAEGGDFPTVLRPFVPKTVVENWAPTRNVLSVLAFLGMAAWMKRRLDDANVKDKSLKPVVPNKVLFESPNDEDDDA